MTGDEKRELIDSVIFLVEKQVTLLNAMVDRVLALEEKLAEHLKEAEDA